MLQFRDPLEGMLQVRSLWPGVAGKGRTFGLVGRTDANTGERRIFQVRAPGRAEGEPEKGPERTTTVSGRLVLNQSTAEYITTKILGKLGSPLGSNGTVYQ